MDAIYTIDLSDADGACTVLQVTIGCAPTYLVPYHGRVHVMYENIRRSEYVIAQAALAVAGIKYKACMRRTPVTPI